MIQVVIADDHHLVRAGLRALLEKADDIDVIGEAIDGQQAVDLVKRLSPGVLVTDIAMPRLNGVEAVKRISASEVQTQVVILSMYSDELLVRRALQSGAKGYLLKDSITDELLLAIRAANRGATYLSPVVSETVMTTIISSGNGVEDPDPLNQLTPREREILQLIGEGYTNNDIAETLHVSVKTVERHRSNLMSKLNVHNLVALMRVAIKYGLIVLDD